MSRTVEGTGAPHYLGMKRSTRLSLIAGVAVFLTLVSGVSFAAWTASSTKGATASAGAVAVTTATTAGAASITTLGPHTYTAANQALTKPITVRNTGSVAATVDSIVIAPTGTLSGDKIDVTFWVPSGSSCSTPASAVSTTLSAGTVSLSSLNMSVAASTSAVLCVSTTFTGSMAADAGESITATFALSTRAGTNWSATDVLSAANRSFTQEIFQSTTPDAPSAIQCTNDTSDNSKIYLSWAAPSGFVTPNNGYEVYWNGTSIGTTTNTNVYVINHGTPGTNTLVTDGNGGNSTGNTGYLTVRAVTSDGTESADSVQIPIQKRQGNSGLACG